MDFREIVYLNKLERFDKLCLLLKLANLNCHNLLK